MKLLLKTILNTNVLRTLNWWTAPIWTWTPNEFVVVCFILLQNPCTFLLWCDSSAQNPYSIEFELLVDHSWSIPVVKYLFSMFLFCLINSNFTIISRGDSPVFVTFSLSMKKNLTFLWHVLTLIANELWRIKFEI